jgi:hypothetical protein
MSEVGYILSVDSVATFVMILSKSSRGSVKSIEVGELRPSQIGPVIGSKYLCSKEEKET